jgi:uncharacterized membrane protein/membrane-bound inhibitor of C-type lysozyme
MLRLTAGALLLSLSVGCSGESSLAIEAESAAPGPDPNARDSDPAEFRPAVARFVYTCETRGPITARFDDDGVHLDLTIEEVFLPHTVSASGARFAADGLVFWSKGPEATLETPGTTHHCVGAPAETPWDAARLRGAELRALGLEPGWVVEVAPERWMHYRGDYGADNVLATDIERFESDGALVYRARTAERHLLLRVAETACTDVISGESFELTATIEVNDRQLHGCGRFL